MENKPNEMNEMKAIDLNDMDTGMKPGENFYLYANGNWIKNHPIPKEFSRYGAFDQLQEENHQLLKALIEEAAAGQGAGKGTPSQLIGDFYTSGMDTRTIDQLGITPLNPYLEKIENINDKKELLEVMAFMHRHYITPFFIPYVGHDAKNSQAMIMNLLQGGLGLPDRDYYTADDARSAELRRFYTIHVNGMFGLMQDPATNPKDAVMAVESILAKHSMTRLERRDPRATYNKVSLRELQDICPSIQWEAYFKQIGVSPPGSLNVAQPDFFKALHQVIQNTPLEELKVYMKWHLLHETASALSSEYEQAHFDFFGKKLSGQEEQQARWKRMIRSTNNALGEAVGQRFVEKHFPPEAKQRMMELVMNLKASLADRVKELDWMVDETKQEALAKLESMNIKIGYPEKWKDYSSLDIQHDNYLHNVLEGRKFAFRDNMEKLGKPADPDEWHMNPQTVNAYYNPNMNEIVFPAAILQPPFFYLHADDAVNYGAIGVVIGHEMTHGFDDQGRHYDKKGNLENWWTKIDEERFKERTKVLVEQYNRFMVFDSLNLGVNGELTLGENIADVGGLNVSYHALEKALEGAPSPEPIDGFTTTQRFFLSYAKVWRQNIRDEELMRRLREDVHSPGEYRVNGAVFNIPEFYEAFPVDTTSPLYLPPGKRANIW
jgi:putative endopeptidase